MSVLTLAPADDYRREVHSVQEHYRRVADAFERKVAAVRPDQWGNRSPCAEWTARDVVDHVVEMHGAMLRAVQRSRRPVPAGDPLAAFQAARAEVEAVLADPQLAGLEVASPYAGQLPVERHIDQVIVDELVVHGWDLARATGQDPTMDPAAVDKIWLASMALGEEVLRTPGVCGPEVHVPLDAPLQDRLLGLLGRDPRWAA